MSATATATRVSRRTAPTLAQWEHALATAQAHGLPLRIGRSQGRYRVPSKMAEGRWYLVTMDGDRLGGCTCDAGRSGRLCAHSGAVALWLYARDSGADLEQLLAVPADVLARRLWTAYGPRREQGRD